MMTHCFDLPIRVLVSKEDGDIVAHALELDLVAYGEDEKSAVVELREMMMAQMSYASQTNRPELVVNPAPKEYFERWEEAHNKALRGSISGDLSRTLTNR